MEKKRGEGIEAQRTRRRLNQDSISDVYETEVYKTIKKKFSSGITQKELKLVAQIICSKTSLKLDREASRDKRVLIKWFIEHWDEIEPHIEHISIYDENDNIIDEDRENNERKAKEAKKN
ncbi:hypothetical protein GPJ56_001892 [Histomonas meleagridis]|uniref:uncharacterized protein n=1 Tax=Histomonas meleagridis TaxID=135588 RepID=UPI003559E572|nr:hypothetical protein GPJ56_001892 [Histomonas meleagridis]KAH0803169.1 hypothetical protein GO595_003905 [Histomonas meleagridis]